MRKLVGWGQGDQLSIAVIGKTGSTLENEFYYFWFE